MYVIALNLSSFLYSEIGPARLVVTGPALLVEVNGTIAIALTVQSTLIGNAVSNFVEIGLQLAPVILEIGVGGAGLILAALVVEVLPRATRTALRGSVKVTLRVHKRAHNDHSVKLTTRKPAPAVVDATANTSQKKGRIIRRKSRRKSRHLTLTLHSSRSIFKALFAFFRSSTIYSKQRKLRKPYPLVMISFLGILFKKLNGSFQNLGVGSIVALHKL